MTRHTVIVQVSHDGADEPDVLALPVDAAGCVQAARLARRNVQGQLDELASECEDGEWENEPEIRITHVMKGECEVHLCLDGDGRDPDQWERQGSESVT